MQSAQKCADSFYMTYCVKAAPHKARLTTLCGVAFTFLSGKTFLRKGSSPNPFPKTFSIMAYFL